MRRVWAKCTLAALVFAGVVALAGCQDGRRDGLRSGPVVPEIGGAWQGTLTSGGSSSPVELEIQQNQINVSGTYAAAGSGVGSASGVVGPSGDLTGLTTGSSFMLTFTPSDPACEGEIQASGLNDGETLAFDFEGQDCGGGDVRGQGVLARP